MGGVTVLATELEVAKGTVHRHLSTMESTGHVVRDGDQYRLGLKFLRLGEHTKNTKQLYVLSKSIVVKLSNESGEQVVFATEEHERAVCIQRAMGEHAVRTNPIIGERKPIHSTSAEKAMLVEIPRSRVDEIIGKHGLEPTMKKTIIQAVLRRTYRDPPARLQLQQAGGHSGVRGVGVAV